MRLLVYNGPMQVASPPSKVALVANTLKTLLQIVSLVTCKLVEWGISFDGSTAGTLAL